MPMAIIGDTQAKLDRLGDFVKLAKLRRIDANLARDGDSPSYIDKDIAAIKAEETVVDGSGDILAIPISDFSGKELAADLKPRLDTISKALTTHAGGGHERTWARRIVVGRAMDLVAMSEGRAQPLTGEQCAGVLNASLPRSPLGHLNPTTVPLPDQQQQSSMRQSTLRRQFENDEARQLVDDVKSWSDLLAKRVHGLEPVFNADKAHRDHIDVAGQQRDVDREIQRIGYELGLDPIRGASLQQEPFDQENIPSNVHGLRRLSTSSARPELLMASPAAPASPSDASVFPSSPPEIFSRQSSPADTPPSSPPSLNRLRRPRPVDDLGEMPPSRRARYDDGPDNSAGAAEFVIYEDPQTPTRAETDGGIRHAEGGDNGSDPMPASRRQGHNLDEFDPPPSIYRDWGDQPRSLQPLAVDGDGERLPQDDKENWDAQLTPAAVELEPEPAPVRTMPVHYQEFIATLPAELRQSIVARDIERDRGRNGGLAD